MSTPGSNQWYDGTIVRGEGRGRALGFPTANIAFTKDISHIPPAIYAAWVQLLPDQVQLPAAAHVGPRPTFPGTAPSFEVHIINFPSQDLYSRRISVQLIKEIRKIETFSSTAELTQAIMADVAKALEIL